ncbi:right-handed parallel beta-helix repeat-containing protein [Peribacillus loiseleuriae]|uniref:right-handed parallel beta-helix repeat-containing protein n=1 Tax=Peribacillus loiseleuriae TaxID=1679170 RepID=UPI003800EBDC
MLRIKYGILSVFLIFFVILFLFIFIKIPLKEVVDFITMNNNVSVKKFDAIPNDKLDDTMSIQNAIDYVATSGGGTVLFPEGVYIIDAVKSIVIRDNIVLKFDKGTILKALPNDKSSYEIVRIHGVKNVSMIGNVVIEGEKEVHTGDKGEWGFGISIRGSENIYLENIVVKNCWGDGIYIGSTQKNFFNKDITIKHPILENNRRQGISVTSVINLKLINPKITNTKGTSPESGIDLEPNEPTERLENVEIINPFTQHNKGYGILINLKYLLGSKHSVSVTVYDTKNVKDEIRIVKPNYVKGTVKVIEVY